MAADTTQAIEVFTMPPDELALSVSVGFAMAVGTFDKTATERGNGGGAGGGTGGDAQSSRPASGQLFPRGY